MPGHSPARCALFGQHEHSPDERWLPTKPIAHDRGTESNLFIKFTEGRLDRHQLGLDFHDQKHTPRRLQRGEIDRPTLAVLRIGDLRHHVPPVPAEDVRGDSNEAGMTLVEEQVDDTVPPEDLE